MKLAAIGVSLLFAQGFDSAMWQYRRPVPVERAGVLHVLALDSSLQRRAATDLSDLRLVLAGREIPYALRSLAGSERTEARSPEVLNRETVAPQTARQTFRLRRPARHSRVRLRISGVNARWRVKVEASPDGKQWSVAKAEAYVFRFEQPGGQAESMDVDYPESDRGWLRITVSDLERPEHFEGADLMLAVRTAPTLNTVATVKPVVSTEDGRNSYLLDFGENPGPYDRVRFEVTTPAFSRSAGLETSDDRKNWRWAGAGSLERVGPDESLTISCAIRRDRWARLRVEDRNDERLGISLAAAELPARIVEFLPQQTGSHFLYYGTPKKVPPPSYDLPGILDRQTFADRVLLRPTAEQDNPAFSGDAGKPWSERHPSLLWGALVIAVGLIAWWTLRAIQRAAR